MVLHGYQRPGTGSTHGNCPGYRWPAFELSVAGTKNWLGRLEDSLANQEKFLRRLEQGEVTELYIERGRSRKPIGPDDPQWGNLLKSKIREIQQTIKSLEGDVKVFGRLVQHWKVRPLPKEGEPHIDWYHQGQKP
jgi:hypothetical protein